MAYLNLDDGMTEHPKVDSLTDGAFRLHMSGMAYCAKHLTDGLIPTRKVSRLKPEFDRTELRELLAEGLWHEGGSGCDTEQCLAGAKGEYVVHDYLQWNKSAAWWMAKRAADVERQAKWRAEREARKNAS